MTTSNEVLTEMHEGIEYELSAVEHQKKGVGLAPTKIPQGDTYDDQLDWMTQLYGSEAIVLCFIRQNKQDAMNAVRSKYSKDKVSASTVIKAIGEGVITPKMQTDAMAAVKAGKHKNFTDACATYLGVGEDALKNADPKHIHWDCAR